MIMRVMRIMRGVMRIIFQLDATNNLSNVESRSSLGSRCVVEVETGIEAFSCVGPRIRHKRLSHGIGIVSHLAPCDGSRCCFISAVVFTIRAFKPFRWTFRNTLVGHPQFECCESNVWMAVQARIFSCMDIRAKVTPSHILVGNFFRAVMRTSAIAIIACRRLATVLKSEVGATGFAINKDRWLELDRASSSISEVFPDDLIQSRLLDVTTTGFKVEKGFTDISSIIGHRRHVLFLDSCQWNKGGNMANAVIVRNNSAILHALALAELGAFPNIHASFRILRAMFDRSVSRLSKEGSGELVGVVSVNGRWVTSFAWVQTGKGLGVIAWIELASFGRGESIEII
mmetsp:Transcript_375/g.517  ORF Transcript_375/g.517 Transcript_375/m.517 type:complete len:343 (+) Transcript_375:247-1275(+)